MTERSPHSRNLPDSLELAAAVAAVTSFIRTSEGHPAETKRSKINSWRAAALLEGTGGQAKNGATPVLGNIWKNALSLAALTVIAIGTPALSLDNQGNDEAPQIAANSVRAKFTPNSYDPAPFAVQSADNTFIRVALALGNRTVQIEAPDGAFVTGGGSDGNVAVLPPHSRWNLSTSRTGSIAFQGLSNRDYAKMAATDKASQAGYVPSTVPTTARLNVPPAMLAVVAQNGGYLIVPSGTDYGSQVVACNGKLYRGALWIRSAPKSDSGPAVDVINILDVEDYLLSVLPSEMPATWPAEALQAQAIAARSYAIANLGKHGRDGYDLKANIEDQVYLGVSSERQSSNDAVSATNRLVLKHDGKPISAFFHSTSGGVTEVSENVWGRPLPYLKSVIDYDDGSPHFAWSKRVQTDEIEKAFAKDIGQVLAVFVVSRSPSSNRVRHCLFVGTTGTKLVSGDNLRMYLKLPSSNFNIGCEENGYTFAGRGFGHGLGMSQYGAKALAEQGYNAAQILAYYYKDVSVEYVAGPPGI